MVVDCDTPLMMACAHGDSKKLKSVLKQMRDARRYTDKNDRKMGITPLICLGMREDTDDIVAMAQLLLDNGARVNTPDRHPGITPIVMAAQEGKVKLVSYFIEKEANLEATSRISTSQAIWLAAQNGHAECVARLALAAAAQGKSILDATNNLGRTPCYIAVMRGRVEPVGVLARAGADLRRASPIYYTEQDSNFDPSPRFKVQYSLDQAVRSFTTYTCAECGKFDLKLLKCSRCFLAFFCNRECQTKGWALHKKCCGKLAKGAKLYGEGPVPEPPTEPFGFVDEFGPDDHAFKDHDDDDDPEPDSSPVWEYDAGSRGHPNWKRYPPYIGIFLEEMRGVGSPRTMYTPHDYDGECTGRYEHDITSAIPPRDVATRYVNYVDMVEREVYTGASRSVRRNGKRNCRDCLPV